MLFLLAWAWLPDITLTAREKGKLSNVFKMSLDELLNVEVASIFPENELNVGSTVHNVTNADWERYGSKHLPEAIGHVPSFFPLPGLFGYSISIRGYTNNLSIRGNSILVDGVPVNNLSDSSSNYEHPFFELGGLDKIEIISGPGSSIYGSDAFHGVLSFKTFERDSDFSSINLEFGTDRYQRANIKLSRGLGKNIRLHSAGAISHQPDQELPFQYTNPFTGTVEQAQRANGYTTASAIVKLDAALKPSLKANLGLYYSHWKSHEFPSAGRFYAGGPSILRDRDVTGNDTDFYMGKGGVTVNLPRQLELSIDAYMWRSNANRIMDMSRLPAFLNPRLNYNSKDDRKQGVDITLKQEKNRLNTQWLLRYQYINSRVAKSEIENVDSETGTLLEKFTEITEGFKRSLNSLVLQARTGFFKQRFYLLYGGRIDQYSDFGTQLTPRLGLIYKPTDNSALKLLYGRAFRAPSPNEALGSELAKSTNDLDPELMDSYELVYTLHTAKSRISLTLFRNIWTQGIQVVSIADPDYNLQYKNTGKNECMGIECSVDADFNPIFLNVNGSYVDSKDVVNDRKYTAFPKYIL
ncbi:MAG: TonB-dependent receptor, partial [bacterium]|nr:TonB-dependent receptor [bacterium]